MGSVRADHWQSYLDGLEATLHSVVVCCCQDPIVVDTLEEHSCLSKSNEDVTFHQAAAFDWYQVTDVTMLLIL